MHTQTIAFDQIRYNPGTGAFEAHVRITDRTDTLDYAVSVPAPVTADYAFVARRLAEAARVAHSRGRGGLRLRRAMAAASLAA